MVDEHWHVTAWLSGGTVYRACLGSQELAKLLAVNLLAEGLTGVLPEDAPVIGVNITNMGARGKARGDANWCEGYPAVEEVPDGSAQG